MIETPASHHQRDYRPVEPLFRFVDLFAGIGGIRRGLEFAGGRCVYTVENDRFAMETYSANFGQKLAGGTREPEEATDIRKVDPVAVPVHEVLAAGFPCQPFSIAGVSKKNALKMSHGFADAKSGDLFFQIIRIIDEGRRPPPVLFLENVKHFMRHDGGKSFDTVRKLLEELRYNLSFKVINAEPWVPQHRERTFIIGLHQDWYGDHSFTFPGIPDASPRRTIGDVLESSAVDPKYTLSSHLWNYLKAYKAKHRAAGNGFGYGLVGPEDVARTLSARYHKDGSEILVRQGKSGRARPRRLTPRECARLMGYDKPYFPAGFEIPVSDTQAYRQFGNSVVVPVVAFLAQALVDAEFLPAPERNSRD